MEDQATGFSNLYKLLSILLLIASNGISCGAVKSASTCGKSSKNLYDFSRKTLPEFGGKTINFSSYQGHVVMAVLGFPCAQFSNQEPGKDSEIMNTLKYVRPGNGFVPKFTLFSKLEVNGAGADSFFSWITALCPRPDPIIATTSTVLWKPIKIGDIQWNFEKFLFDHTGKPVKRYSETYFPSLMEEDIKSLISNCMKQKRDENIEERYEDREIEDDADM
eukprot:gene16824-18522_t